MKTRQGVKNVKYCPNCDASHHIYARTFTSRLTGNTSTVPSELQEAQAGTHPVLGRVDNLIKTFGGELTPVEKFKAKDIESAVAALTQVYGEPQTSKEHSEIINTNIFSWTWSVPTEDDQYHDDLVLTYFRDDPTAYLELV